MPFCVMRPEVEGLSGPIIQTECPNSRNPSARPRHCSSVPPPVKRELNCRMRSAAVEPECKGVAGSVLVSASRPQENKVIDIVFSFRIAVRDHVEVTDRNAAVLREEEAFVAEIGQVSEYLAIGIAAVVPFFTLEKQCRLIPTENS